MTHQFKFGDRALWNDKQFVYLHQDEIHSEAGWVVSDGGCQYLVAHIVLQAVPHPDTERIDWLAAQDDIDITLGNTVQLKPCLRAHIDAAMQEQAAEAKE
jgi:hypothetical protein